MILDCPASRTVKKKFLFISPPVCGILLAAQIKTIGFLQRDHVDREKLLCYIIKGILEVTLLSIKYREMQALTLC